MDNPISILHLQNRIRYKMVRIHIFVIFYITYYTYIFIYVEYYRKFLMALMSRRSKYIGEVITLMVLGIMVSIICWQV